MKKSVALKYIEENGAPFITAKGEGIVADKIVESAMESGIPVKEDEMLVEILEKQEIGQNIPESAWKAVALIFSFILNQENNE
ncbi:MAG: EscU/YscU/HrcU family type III secretion system export apparatus switch protein [Treponema sp.]|nr:EscU/YscU/HrcU family type III secretion system export apparatus switch protein [Spirochaetia bacterium]MDY2839571.1 EscU/YscU/HrcU family type III secretion system export apparatus switch protein [Treponema sp.]MDY5123193.1 EscU/YscU/HrcU family type III secretion system export apparatus switch protein [Treponema sp.]